jgi:AcrR family transcriptional regulator
MPNSPQIRKPPKERKAEILEGCYQVFKEEGIEGTSMGKIAKALDIHQSLIHHYLGTKENMILELTDYVVAKFDDTGYRKSYEDIADPRKRLKAFLDALFNPGTMEVVDSHAYFALYYLSHRKPEIRKRFQAMFRRFRDYLVQELSIFKAHKVIQVENPVLTADLIVALLEGVHINETYLREGKPHGEFATYAKQIMAAVLNLSPIED